MIIRRHFTQGSIYHKFILYSTEEPFTLEMKLLLPGNSFRKGIAAFSWSFSYIVKLLNFIFSGVLYRKMLDVLFPKPLPKSFSMIGSECHSHHYSCLPLYVRHWQEIAWQKQNLYSHFVKLEMNFSWLKLSLRKIICRKVFALSSPFL